VPLETQVTNWGDLPSDITDYHYKYHNLTELLWDLCVKRERGLFSTKRITFEGCTGFSNMLIKVCGTGRV
jgi:hypothetical protein